MVIACSKCQTRFHVEDARIPDEGVRVRCSRCKHAFFVRPPRAPADAAVHAVAEAAAASDGTRAPEPSMDLDGGAPEPAPGAGEEEDRFDRDAAASFDSAGGVAGGEEEDDWQFAIDPPNAVAERGASESLDASADLPTPSLSARSEARRAAGFEEPETSSLADLESPESWNLLSGEGAEEAERRARGSSATEYEAEEAPSFEEPHGAVAPPPRESVARSSRVLGLAGRALGWIALVALLAVLGRGLLPVGGPTPVASVGSVTFAGLEVRELRGRIVENALAGPLFVVTGTLANPSPGPRMPGRAIRVVLLDAAGRPLPGASLAGLPLTPSEVRLVDPTELLGALESSAGTLAWRTFAAGEGASFQAVFEGLDPTAVAFRIEEAPATRPSRREPPPGEPLEGGSPPDASAAHSSRPDTSRPDKRGRVARALAGA